FSIPCRVFLLIKSDMFDQLEHTSPITSKKNVRSCKIRPENKETHYCSKIPIRSTFSYCHLSHFSKVTVEKGKTYYWCACGRSKNQPFCDGTLEPNILTIILRIPLQREHWSISKEIHCY